MRQEFGMLEYHYELPNLSPRRYQLQVPVNYVSHWALVVINGSCLPGSHECHLGIYCGGWLLKQGLFQSKTEMSSKGSRYSSSIMVYLCVQSVVDTLGVSLPLSELGIIRDPKLPWSSHRCWVKIAQHTRQDVSTSNYSKKQTLSYEWQHTAYIENPWQKTWGW